VGTLSTYMPKPMFAPSSASFKLHLYGPRITPFLEHAAESVEAKPVEVRLDGNVSP